ncbi:MAG: hypothetical protein KJ607_11540 [Bacteroidetes bacterium]|nr:hypothetical protein [Bacteroidota bacterium]
MNRLILSLLILVLFCTTVRSQVDDIRSAADGLSTIADISDDISGGDLWFLFFFDDVVFWAIDGLVAHQVYLKENRDIIPQSFSVDYMSHFASDAANQLNIQQRFRGTWGVLSTDLRYNHLAAFRSGTADSYQTINWQVFIMNFQAGSDVNLRFGSGLLYDKYTDKTYNEHYASLGISFFDQAFRTVLEGRFANEYRNGAGIYREVSLSGNIHIFQFDNMTGYLSLGGMYHEYFSEVGISFVQTGLILNFH